MAHYCLVSGVRVQRINMMQTQFLLSPLPVFAAVMLGHAVGARITKAQGYDQPVTGVGIVHLSASPHVEVMPMKGGATQESLHVPRGACGYYVDGGNQGGDYAGEPRPMGVANQHRATADWQGSLVFRFDDAPDLSLVRDALIPGRLGGGFITSVRSVTLHKSLEGVVGAVGGGFWVRSAEADVQARMAAGDSIIEAVMFQPQQEGAWLVPVTVGYSALTGFAERRGVREPGLQHAFAEALVGLVRLESIKSTLAGFVDRIGGEESPDDAAPPVEPFNAAREYASAFPFWEHSWDRATNTFLISTSNKGV